MPFATRPTNECAAFGVDNFLPSATDWLTAECHCLGQSAVPITAERLTVDVDVSCRRLLDDVRCRRHRIIRRRRLVAAVGSCLDVRQGSSIVIRRRTARRRLSTTWITFRRPLVPLDCITTLSPSWAAHWHLLPSLVSFTSPPQLLDRWTTDVPGAVGPSFESAAV